MNEIEWIELKEINARYMRGIAKLNDIAFLIMLIRSEERKMDAYIERTSKLLGVNVRVKWNPYSTDDDVDKR